MSASGRLVDVVGTGFVVLDRIHADRSVSEVLGGTCGNVLITLAMLGWSVAPLVRIGDDDEGHRLVEEFREAGAETGLISVREGERTPIVAQYTDVTAGRHRFSFVDEATGTRFPPFSSIAGGDVAKARQMLEGCAAFFADRVSPDILSAMRLAREHGAVVVFEPSEARQAALFREAVALATIVKVSADRIDPAQFRSDRGSGQYAIVTRGCEGTDVRVGDRWMRLPAAAAPALRDTAGAGDMVSVGLLDAVLRADGNDGSLDPAVVIEGVVAGQRLAAANCAFVGARGLLQALGALHSRAVLDGRAMP